MNRLYPLHSAVHVLLTGGRSHPLVHPQAEQLGYRMLNQFACSASRQTIYRRTTQWCRHTTHSPTSTFVVPSGAAAGVSVLLTSVFDRLSSVKLYVAEPEETVTHAEPSEYGISAKINTDPLTLQLCADPTINRLQEQMWFYAHGDWHFCENWSRQVAATVPDASALLPFVEHCIPAAFVSGERLNSRTFEVDCV